MLFAASVIKHNQLLSHSLFDGYHGKFVNEWAESKVQRKVDNLNLVGSYTIISVL